VVPEDLQAQGLRELKALDEALSRTPQGAGLLGRHWRASAPKRTPSACLPGNDDPAPAFEPRPGVPVPPLLPEVEPHR
jgi:hypothetical protein